MAFRNMEHHHRSTLKQVFTLTILHDPCDSLGLVPQSVGVLAGLWSIFASIIQARVPALSFPRFPWVNLGGVTWLNDLGTKYDTYHTCISCRVYKYRVGRVWLYLYLFLSWAGRRVGRNNNTISNRHFSFLVGFMLFVLRPVVML